MDDLRLSFLGQRWERRSDPQSARTLIEAGCPPLIAQILVGRGIETIEEARAFLDSGLHRLHDPLSLKGVAQAVERIVQALKSKETIGVYGDYDVDGQTSAALMARVLGALGADVRTYIPHRTKEGYGLHIPALKILRDQGCSLVVTVDCGISAFEAAAWAQGEGLDLIITDHHQPHDRLPDAVAVINPQLDPGYPCRHLAGCGVAFKLAEALAEAATGDRELAHRWVELVAVGTVADVVPLQGENRALVRAGLEKLNSGRAIPGLEALRAVAGIKDAVTAGHIGFALAPRLNAVGRVGDATVGLRLLLADRYDEALPLARKLEEENEARRRLEEEVADQARRLVEEAFDPRKEHGLVVDGRGWHPGVIGIVASRLAESYYRPTVVISVEGELARGSGRSIPGFDLYRALEACSRHFIAFGGHQAAAGLTLATVEIEAFRESFRQVTRSLLSPDDLIPRLSYDAEVPLDAIDTEWVEALQELEPCGMGNPAPVLVVRNCRVQAEAVGKDKSHLRLWVEDPARGRRLDGIGFGMAKEILPQLRPGAVVDIAFMPDVNEWNGRRWPQLRVRDVRDATPEAFDGAVRGMVETAAAGDDVAPARNGAAAMRGGSPAVHPPVRRDSLGRAAPAPGTAVPPLAEVAAALRKLAVRDMRGVTHRRVLETLRELGRTAWIVPAFPELAPEVAREMEALALEHEGVIVIPPRLGGPRREMGAHDALDGARPGAIVLWHAPAHPRESLVHLYRLSRQLPDAPLIVAMEEERDRRAGARVEAAFPDREVLGRIYVAIRDAVQSGRRLDAGAIALAVEARWPGLATLRAVREALAIFTEVGLVKASGGGVALSPTQGKVDLTRSLRYNESVAIRSEYLRFAARLREAAAESVVQLLIERGTPWWPQST